MEDYIREIATNIGYGIIAFIVVFVPILFGCTVGYYKEINNLTLFLGIFPVAEMMIVFLVLQCITK